MDIKQQENPSFIYGDLVKCKETGALMIITDLNHDDSGCSCDHLPNQPSVKNAWWTPTEIEG